MKLNKYTPKELFTPITVEITFESMTELNSIINALGNTTKTAIRTKLYDYLARIKSSL